MGVGEMLSLVLLAAFVGMLIGFVLRKASQLTRVDTIALGFLGGLFVTTTLLSAPIGYGQHAFLAAISAVFGPVGWWLTSKLNRILFIF